MRKIFTIVVLLCLIASAVIAQSTYQMPVAGYRHVYTAIFDRGNHPTRWYVATGPDGTRAKYGEEYVFDEFADGIAYNPELDALTGTDLMAVSIRWGLSVIVGTEYYVFVEVEQNGCSNRMAMKVVIAEDTTPKNLPPIAVTDYNTTQTEQPVYTNLLANDFDPDGDSIYLSAVYPASSGASVTVVNGDSVLYVPQPGFVGTDTIIYRICDTGDPSLCDADTLFIFVKDRVIAVPDYAELYAGDQTEISILPNDTFSAPVTVSLLLPPEHGRYYLDAGNRLVFQADNDYMGLDSLIYSISNAGGSDTAMVRIHIKPQVSLKALAYCNGTEPMIFWEATTLGFIPTSTTLKLYDINGKLVENRTITSQSGVLPWPGTTSKSSPLPPAELTSVNLNIEFEDLAGEIFSARLYYPECYGNTIVAVTDTATIFGHQTVLSVLDNDYDPDQGEIDSSSVALYLDSTSRGPYHGTVRFNDLGLITYTPELNYNGLDSFVYIVCDDYSPTACDTAIVRLTLWYNAPIVAQTDYKTIYIGQTALINILANDKDPENQIDLTSVDLIEDPENGNAIISADGMLTYQPLTGFTGLDSMLYTVCDQGKPRTCDTAWIYVNVVVNQTILANRDDVITYAGTQINFDPLVNDFDPEGEIDTASLVFVTGQEPHHGQVVIENGRITYQPENGFAGTDSFIYRLCDAGFPPACDTAIVYISVIDNNLGIVAMVDQAYAIDGNPVIVPILDNDYDPDTISTIDLTSVTITQQPVNGTVLVNPDGSLTYTPDPGFYGSDTLIYRVCDNAPIIACDTALVVLISSTELPPVATNDTTVVLHGITTVFDISDNDYDPAGHLDSLSIQIISPATNGNLSYDKSTGAFSYLPDICNFGLDSFTYVIYNESGLVSNVATVYIKVEINPTIDLDGDGVLDINENLAGTYNLCDTDTDKDGTPNYLDPDDDGDGIPTRDENQDLDGNLVPDYLEKWNSKAVDDEVLTGLEIPALIPILDNDSLTMVPSTLHILDNPTHGYITVDMTTSIINYSPDIDYIGSDSLRYVVCDYYNICDTATVKITVEDILIIPELFSPNGDQWNQNFVIKGLENYPKNHFVVFNRWGNKVYEQENYANDWDGTSNSQYRLGSKPLPIGVYYFILKYGNNREIQRGFYLER